VTRFSAIIIDDEPLAREGLRRICDRDGRVDVIDSAGDGETALHMIAATAPDAVFLDIGMPGLGGMEVAARLKARARRPAIVFVTAYDHFATEAFDLAVVDYVLKPVESARLGRAIDRVVAAVGDRTVDDDRTIRADAFWAPHRGSLVRVPLPSIESVEAEGDYVRLYTPSGSHLIRQSMAVMAARLTPALFIRVHRSAIIRKDRVIEFRHLGAGVWAAIDRNGRAFRVGRSYLTAVRDLLRIPPCPDP
jgi:two-component system response regulator AlgR